MYGPLARCRLLASAILFFTGVSLQAQVNLESTLPAAGGACAANGTTRLAGSFGQPIIGPVTTPQRHLMQGFWVAEKSSSATAAVAEESSLSLLCLPNPVSAEAAVEISLPEAGPATVSLYDLAGRSIVMLMNGVEKEGRQAIQFDARELAAGEYVLVLRSGEKRATLPIRIVR